MMDQPLSDKTIADMVEQLSGKEMSLVAVIYMNTTFQELQDIKRGGVFDKPGIQTIIKRWKNDTGGTVQKFADILKTSGILDRKAIKKCLRVEKIGTIEERQPSGDADMDEWELARVAVKFSSRVLQNAMSKLENISHNEIDNIKYDNPADCRFQLFEILLKWSRETEDNRRILINALKKERDIDPEDIRKYVGELTSLPAPGKGNLTGETTSPKDGLTAAGGGDPSSELEENIESNKYEKTEETSTGHFKKQKTEENPKPSHDPEIDPDTTDGGDVYDMDPEHPGYVLIFNNEVFKDSSGNVVDIRKGTKKDVERLESVFSDRGFDVVTEHNLSAKDMITKIKVFVKQDTLKSEVDGKFDEKLVKNFLRKIKLDEQKIKKKEEHLDDLEKTAFEKGRQTFQRRFPFIEGMRKEIDQPITKDQRKYLQDEFKLEEEEINRLDKPMTDDQIKGFMQEDINLNESGILQFTDKMNKVLKKTNCSVVVFMSHGGNGFIQGSDLQTVEVNKLINEFTSDNCSALEDKPKAFLIQACRGDGIDWKFMDEGGEKKSELEPYFKNQGQATPACADMIVGYATTPGYVAFRDGDDGADFIQRICDVVDTCADEMDVLAMTTKVNKRVAAANQIEKLQVSEKIQVKQMSEFTHSLRAKWKMPYKGKK